MAFPNSGGSFFHWMIISATTMLCCFHLLRAGDNVTERLSLLAIKDSISDDPLSVMSSWNDTLHFCEWYGVTCGRRHKRVTKLELHSSKLTGIISPHIGNLSFLLELHLQDNVFSGTIPPEIGRLHRLRTLWLFNNSFFGEIPSNISNCDSLIDIQFMFNKLLGEIPPSLGSLSYLKTLSLSHNNLTGNIPASLGNLSSSLSKLTLRSNNFYGTIPYSLGKLKNMTYLSLEDNMLHAIVPSSIFNLSLLTTLSLAQNNFQGNLPVDLGDSLPRLQLLAMGMNRFDGHIPTSISNASNLNLLQLNQNNLQGQVPSLHKLSRLSRLSLFDNSLEDLNFVSSLANATQLQWLEIGQNKFEGTFPQIICNFSLLTTLAFEDNNIVGEIPICIENLVKLQYFTAMNNKLSGVIPLSIGKLDNLYVLYLNDNRLSGVIPSSIGNLTKLYTLSLSNNIIEGHIPSTLGKCTSLTSFFLANNNLNGTIPSQLFNLPDLSVQVDLSRNHLTGSLSDEVGQLNNLQTLILSQNMLSGHIPSSLSSCVALEYLYLAQNKFDGTIPDALDSLKGLLELDLSYNNLSGPIPQYLATLPLRLLNISHNNLQGGVPIGGVFNNGTAVLVSGNSRLCGGLLEFKLPTCNVSLHKIRGGRRNNKLLITITLSTFSGVTLLLVLLYIILGKKNKAKEPKFPLVYSENFPNLSYQALVKATNGFSSENLIGSGTSGIVYKGIIDENESTVAIKIFKLEGYHHAAGSKSFMDECEVLRNIKHRNLLKVITACSSIDHQGREFKALVYEYMVNGSLESWLHPSQSFDQDNGTYITSKNLNFVQRLDIAIDVAFCLDYLHHQCDAPIVHCDLKPSNILLDEQFVAHVGDFGLAKFSLQGTYKSHANQSSSIAVRGTIGYTPPEYGLGNEVTTSGDVYSFGILLLEMFTGKRPTNDTFKEGMSLHFFVKTVVPEEVTTIVDHTLLVDINEENETKGSVMLEALKDIFEVALSCSNEVPQERLDMNGVAANLSLIKNKLLNT